MLSRFQLKTEKARRRLHEFVEQAWHVLEPQTPFVDGMHVRAICDHLQAVTEGRDSESDHQRSPGPRQIAADRSVLAGLGLDRSSRIHDGCSVATGSPWPRGTALNAVA